MADCSNPEFLPSTTTLSNPSFILINTSQITGMLFFQMVFGLEVKNQYLIILAVVLVLGKHALF